MAKMDEIDTSQPQNCGRAPDNAGPPAKQVFHSTLAGSWYPADEGGLLRELDACRSRVPDRSLDEVCGLILPHAGYQWSGTTAAHGTRLLRPGRWDRVVVLGPSHRVRLDNLASLPEETHFATPLGELPLDRPMIERLAEHRRFVSSSQAQHGEHSVQIEIPLLQQALGTFRLVPIVVGQLDLETAREIAAALRACIDQRTLVVASSDFTHYGWRFGYVPFRDDLAENIKRLDMGAFEQIRAKDAAGFLEYTARTEATICGRHAIAILLAMLPDEAGVQLLHYDTSGRLCGDYSNSVSYMAIAFTGQWPAASTAAEQQRETPGRDHPAALLRLAHESLRYAIRHGQAPTIGELGIHPGEAMQQVAGAFVTLRRGGELRGCVGEIYPNRPLYQVIIQQTLNAALNDSRFPPVTEDEIGELSIEVSVLTVPRSVKSLDEVSVGKHGIILRKGARCAVFLPKVAAEHGWTLEETLNHLAHKAGLAPDSWREGAAIQVFEATCITDKP